MLNLCRIFHSAGPRQCTRTAHFLACTCTISNDLGTLIHGRAIRFQIQMAGNDQIKHIDTIHIFAKQTTMLLLLSLFQVLVFIAIILNGANLYGYIKCNYGSNTNLNSAASDFVRKQVFRNAFDFMSRPSQPTGSSTGIV